MLYTLLAVFQLLTIGASLFISYRLERYYSGTLDSHELWNSRRHKLSELEQLAIAASMPSRDALEAGDWEQEQRSLHYAASLFCQRAQQFSAEVKQSNDPQSKSVWPDLDSLNESMKKLGDQADQAFAAYQSGDAKQLDAHLMYADRAYGRVWLALGNVRDDIYKSEEDNLKQQELMGRRVRQRNSVLQVFALLLLVAVILYARRLYRQVRATDEELLAQREALEQRVHERTRELRNEIEERKRIEKFDSIRNHLLEMVTQNEPVEKILELLAQAVEDHRPGARMMIRLPDAGKPAICSRTTSALMGELGEEILDASPAGMAKQNNRVTIMEDLLAETTPRLIRGLAQTTGLRAWWGSPITMGGGSPCGTVSLLFSEPSAMKERDQEIMTMATRMAGLAIENCHIHEELLRQARYDALTGLPNRVLCEDRLRQAIARARRHGRRVAVLCLDLDNFKLINDTYGHIFGDLLLKQIGVRLLARLRTSDTLSRMGGDEFMVILEEIKGVRAVEHTAANLLRTLSEPILIDGLQVQVTGSLGGALFPGDGVTPDQLQRHADHAMYRAKDRGRNQFQMFSFAMSHELEQRQKIEAELERALETGRLELWYQPQYTRSGELSGLEALLRFDHPALGLIAPERFIAIAEESGMIVRIGDWVLREVCRQSLEWQRQGFDAVRIAVNVSPLQFTRFDFAETVSEIVLESGLRPDLLELELTESLVMGNIEESARQMRALKNLGVHISIDDFGTGHSSLSYLHRLPIDTLKIDRSFIERINEPGGTLAIVQTIVALARNLDLRVIGEGVETEQQLETLRAAGCDFVQGFLFSKPLPAASAVDLLRRQAQGASLGK
jgi:diguanylate cyclase (GGDEF)-like protein